MEVFGMTFLWVIIYLVAGFGAYWIHMQEYNCIMGKIENKFTDHASEVYYDFYHKTQLTPKTGSQFCLIMIGLLSVTAIWTLWPLFVIVGGIYEWLVYKHLDRIWSERLGIE